MLAIPRAQRCGLYTELADSIWERERKIAVGHVVVVIAAIEPPHGCVAHAAGNRDGDGLVGVLAAGEVPGGSRRGATGEGDQGCHLPAIERHLCNRLLVDGLLERAVLRLQGEA